MILTRERANILMSIEVLRYLQHEARPLKSLLGTTNAISAVENFNYYLVTGQRLCALRSRFFAK